MITTLNSSVDVCETAYVLDAAGFFAALQLMVQGKVYTTEEVIKEVRDVESRKSLELGLSAGKVEVLKPTAESLKFVRELSSRMGELGRLSKADISILGVAKDLMRACRQVVVVTDDRSVQNVALGIGASVIGIKRKALKKPRRYVYVCPSCERVYQSPGTCPYCGSKLRRVRADKAKPP